MILTAGHVLYDPSPQFGGRAKIVRFLPGMNGKQQLLKESPLGEFYTNYDGKDIFDNDQEFGLIILKKPIVSQEL